MAQGFTRDVSNPDHIIGFLDNVERSVVIELLYQTSVLLSDGASDSSDEAATAAEQDIFARLSASMEPREAPQDPALRRLLPDGVKDDDEAASEFRRFTEDSLRAKKLANLETAMSAFEAGFVDDEEAAALADADYDVATTGAHRRQPDDDDDLADGLEDETREIVMTIPQARATMMALTDVRLVLAERLEIRTDEDADRVTERAEGGDAPSSSEDLMAMYYDFLTWLAESITVAVMSKA